MRLSLRSRLKQAARSLLIPRGRKQGLMAWRDRFDDMHGLIGRDDPVLIDGGANKGDTVELMLRRFPTASVHAFEPIPALATRLLERFQRVPAVTVHSRALGAEATTIDFHVTANLVSSSALAPSAANRAVHGGMVATAATIRVEQVRLDAIGLARVDGVKLDLQGYELAALRGMEGLLPAMTCLVLEVQFMPMYERQGGFAEINAFLSAHGFTIFNFYELWTRGSGRLESCDVMYARPDAIARVDGMQRTGS